ncbi:hypothetical protein UPYG_G00215990 [Umbra pygmaea]|uniref:AIP/AIPL N-terminal FKBP-type PPIase domain-containing protein n=1 Tax=Umbra pygmaea TaxID=75934 RepID=A0ABD0WKR1_UMBPY
MFHFQTLLDNFERTVIDDSRKGKQPVEIFVGKMFKMEVWEPLLTSMRVGEVAEFWCDAVHTGLYPIVSKGLRLIAQGKDPLEGQRHTCGMGNLFHYNSTGWTELDELMRTPQPLIFIMELIQVGDPFSYKRDSWIMDKDEKMKEVPSLHLQGNALVRQRRFREAAEKYQEAVVLLRIVLSKEMPGDEDYIAVDKLITPLVLNYCQCMLELEEFYEVLEHTSDLIDKHKDCVKAYYKRAKAHAAVWNDQEARRDFLMVARLDSSLGLLVHKELRLLSDRMKEKHWEEKEAYWNCLQQEGKTEEEEEEEEEEKEVLEKKEGEAEKADEAQDESGETVVKEEEVKNEISWNKVVTKGDTSITATVKDKARVKDRTASQAVGSEGTAKAENSLETRPVTNESVPFVHPAEGMDWQQKLRHIMFLQKEGNFLLKEHKYSEASGKLKEALEFVDFLQKEVEYKDRKDDWDSLEKVRVPITLNLSQCLLELRDYQQVVLLNTKLLNKDRDNFKAVYQRARAHTALCNEEAARKDFQHIEGLEPRFKPIVKQEMKKLGENLRIKHVREKKTYWEITEEKWRAKARQGKMKKTVNFQEKIGAERSVGKEEETDPAVKEQDSDGEREGKGDGKIVEEGGSSEEVKKAEAGEKKKERAELEREGVPGDRTGSEDSQRECAPADRRATKSSRGDEAEKKGKHQSSTKQQGTNGSRGNKSTNKSTRSSVSPSSSTNRSPSASIDNPNPQVLEVAGEGVRLDMQMTRADTHDEERKTEKNGSDQKLCLFEDGKIIKPGVSAGIHAPAKSKSKRKQKKKK